MKIVLPQTCIGTRILEVFAQAATFEIQPEKRWDAVETVEAGGIVVAPIFVRRGAVFKKKGVDIIMSTKKKRWVFFGERVWKPEETPVIRLAPLEPDLPHERVEISVRHIIIHRGRTLFVQNPDDPHFAEFLPHYQATLRRFFSKVVHGEHIYT